MTPHEKLRKIRKEKQYSQEEFAHKLEMSLNGYAKIERGETRLYSQKLQQIVGILDIDLPELLDDNDLKTNIDCDLNDHASNIINASTEIVIELQKALLVNKHQQEMLKQKEKEIIHLTDTINMLQT